MKTPIWSLLLYVPLKKKNNLIVVQDTRVRPTRMDNNCFGSKWS